MSNFIKKPINGFVNRTDSISAFFLDQKAPEVSSVKMSTLILKNGRTSWRKITGNDSGGHPRLPAIQRGPRQSCRLLATAGRRDPCPQWGCRPSRLGCHGGQGMLVCWLEDRTAWEAENPTQSGFGASKKARLEIMLS